MIEENKHARLTPAASRILLSSSNAEQVPVLSIAIPTYRRFGLLKETLNSVFSLDFSFPVEVLIVDNDPEQSDLALKEMAEFSGKEFTYYKNDQNLGMFGNWNQCLSLAKGKYITLLHDDDILLKEFASQMNNLLMNNLLDCEIISFSVGLLDLRVDRPSNNLLSENRFKTKLKKLFPGAHCEKNSSIEFFFSNPFCGTLGIVMNRNLALSLQGFDKNWYPVADYEFWCRWASQIGPIPFVRKQIGLYRLQENESLQLDVRKGFVSGSTSIRQVMLAQRNVPHWFVHMVRIVAWFQEKSINIDWRTRYEPDPIFFRMIVLRLWWKTVSFLCYCYRK